MSVREDKSIEVWQYPKSDPDRGAVIKTFKDTPTEARLAGEYWLNMYKNFGDNWDYEVVYSTNRREVVQDTRLITK